MASRYLEIMICVLGRKLFRQGTYFPSIRISSVANRKQKEIRGTREWAVAEINCSSGCPHGCRYCYARSAALVSGHIESAEDWLECVVDEKINREYPCFSGPVMFPTAHDIVEENLEISLDVIDQLLKSGNRVLVVSKPSLICIKKICDRFSQMKNKILFRFTITARNQEILSYWEPGAPSYDERKKALKMAFNRGFTTSVSIEPMLDAGDVVDLVADVQNFVNHSIWVGKMNKIEQRVMCDSKQAQSEVDRIEQEQSDERIMSLYQQLHKNQLIRWKESIKEVVGLPMASQAGLDQ